MQRSNLCTRDSAVIRTIAVLYSSAPYPQVIHSKTYRDYVKPQIILNAICNVIFV
jgi:hypothetical protein